MGRRLRQWWRAAIAVAAIMSPHAAAADQPAHDVQESAREDTFPTQRVGFVRDHDGPDRSRRTCRDQLAPRLQHFTRVLLMLSRISALVAVVLSLTVAAKAQERVPQPPQPQAAPNAPTKHGGLNQIAPVWERLSPRPCASIHSPRRGRPTLAGRWRRPATAWFRQLDS